MGCVTSRETALASKLTREEQAMYRHRTFIQTRRRPGPQVGTRGAPERGARDSAEEQEPPLPRKFSYRPKARGKGRAKGQKKWDPREGLPEEEEEVERLVVHTEVMRKAGMFEAMDAKAREEKAPLEVKITPGRRSSKVVMKFEEKERLARTLPSKVEVSPADLENAKIGDRLKGFEEMEAKARAEPKLVKSFSQRMIERGEPDVNNTHLAKVIN